MTVRSRAWIILLAFLALEFIPFSLTFALSPPGALRKLYLSAANGWLPWVGALVITIVYVAYAARAFPLIRENFLRLNSMKLVAMLFAVVTGTVEELYFRKFLMDWAAHHGAAAVGQVVVSAAVFGVGHGVWGLFAKQWRMAVGATLATGILGGLLALVYFAAGRHVAPCIWAHMLINLAIEPWLILAAASAGAAIDPSPVTA